MIPDETIDRAIEAFHQALDTHLDYPGATCSRPREWVDAPVAAVVEALLLSGWVGPLDDSGEPSDLELAETGDQRRQVPRCRTRRPMLYRYPRSGRDDRA